MPNRKKQSLQIVPLEFNDRQFLQKLGMNLQDIIPVICEVIKPLSLPPEAYTSMRRQFNATAVLNIVYPKIRCKDLVLLVTDRDLYSIGLNFVFGEAHMRKGIAIISLARLHQSFYGLKKNPELFFIRTLKEAVHELGHLFKMDHCPDPRCVMHFSNSLSDTDKKDYNFCTNCSKYLE